MAAKNILIIDDDKENYAMMKEVLEGGGYVVHVASNRIQATSEALALNPALIFVKAMLIDASGYEFIRDLRSNESLRDVPIVLLTEIEQKHDYRSMTTYKITETLKLPVDANMLLSKAKRYAGFSFPNRNAESAAAGKSSVSYRGFSITADESDETGVDGEAASKQAGVTGRVAAAGRGVRTSLSGNVVDNGQQKKVNGGAAVDTKSKGQGLYKFEITESAAAEDTAKLASGEAIQNAAGVGSSSDIKEGGAENNTDNNYRQRRGERSFLNLEPFVDDGNNADGREDLTKIEPDEEEFLGEVREHETSWKKTLLMPLILLVIVMGGAYYIFFFNSEEDKGIGLNKKIGILKDTKKYDEGFVTKKDSTNILVEEKKDVPATIDNHEKPKTEVKNILSVGNESSELKKDDTPAQKETPTASLPKEEKGGSEVKTLIPSKEKADAALGEDATGNLGQDDTNGLSGLDESSSDIFDDTEGSKDKAVTVPLEEKKSTDIAAKHEKPKDSVVKPDSSSGVSTKKEAVSAKVTEEKTPAVSSERALEPTNDKKEALKTVAKTTATDKKEDSKAVKEPVANKTLLKPEKATVKKESAKKAEVVASIQRSKSIASKPKSAAKITKKAAPVFDEPIDAEEKSSSTTGSYALQIGAFKDYENAQKAANIYKAQGYSTFIESVKLSKGEFQRVYVGKYSSRNEAISAKKKIKGSNSVEPIMRKF
ncbi:MAG: SPOR domain-containing protein [Candidatus Magnetoovum sp. WYHC-5]|nr:SPOR domain-containing protein [Candidatus Magnetoovum sp. WYHC-5]